MDKPSTSAEDRKRIERRQKITTVIVIAVLLAVVVGLVIWMTSYFGASAGNLQNILVSMAF